MANTPTTRTRCAPGDIAVITRPDYSGKLVTVLRSHQGIFNDKYWSNCTGPAWVVLSLGMPFCCTLNTSEGEVNHQYQCVPINDSELRPLRDGEREPVVRVVKSKKYKSTQYTTTKE